MAFKIFGKGKTEIDELSEDLIDLSADEIGAETVASSISVGSSIVEKIFSIKNIGAGFVGILVLVGYVLFLNTTQAERDTRYIERSSNLLMLSQRIAKDAREAVQGQKQSFQSLKVSRDTFEQTVSALKRGNATMGIEPTPSQVRPTLLALDQMWAPKDEEGVRGQVDQILKQEKALFSLRDHVLAINQLSPLLLAISDEIVELGVRSGMSQQHLYWASRQGMLSQRIAKDVNLFAQGGNEAAVAAAQFGKDSKLFKDTDARLRRGIPRNAPADLREKMREAKEVFAEMNAHVEGILGNAAELFVSQRASQQIFEESDKLLSKVQVLVASYTSLSSGRTIYQIAAAAGSLLLIALVVLMGWRLVQDEKNRGRET
ncbi:MAG: type IV pili methyl-accepting chemotaxis transducer N-terminal domain-containing protein, partial [Acidiferrobacterales bacterium]